MDAVSHSDKLAPGTQVRIACRLNPEKYVQYTVQEEAAAVVFDADPATQTVGPGADPESERNWDKQAECKMFLWTVRNLAASSHGVPRRELLDQTRLHDREMGMFASRFLVPAIVTSSFSSLTCTQKNEEHSK